MRRLGILGGTFDPIHTGHIDLGRAAVQALGLSELLVVPANVPPHRREPSASAYHRFAMAALGIVGLETWRASDLELVTGGRSFTSETLKALAAAGYSPRELFFLTGADAFAEIETWNDYPALLDQAHFAVVSRPGFTGVRLSDRLPHLQPRMIRAPFDIGSESAPLIFLIDAVTMEVSSTAIRRRVGEGRPIGGLVPPLVEQHIERHRLYRAAHSRIDSAAAPADTFHGKE
jgi:nicotinate-nucleotide adenylyltransferase